MGSLSVETLPVSILDREGFWLQNKAGETPASTTLNPDFLSLVHSGNYVDIGCCSGRASRELVGLGCTVIGIDPNNNELMLGKSLNGNFFNIPYIQSYGQELPFKTDVFDGALLLAVLGAVDKHTRESILTETVRCLKPNGLIYLAEFAYITDGEKRTTTGKKWIDVYEEDYLKTGEHGSVIVQNADGSTKFIGHHFQQKELTDLFIQNGLHLVGLENAQVKSSVSGQLRDNWNAWGYKL